MCTYGSCLMVVSTLGVFLAVRGIVNYEDARFPFYCEEIGTSNQLFHHCTITWNV